MSGDALLIFGIKMPKTGGLFFSVLLLHAFFPVGKKHEAAMPGDGLFFNWLV
ncbi:hypothetical protein ACIAET_25835 [Klebsiella quasipneumoniae subsp. similipneumoniae]|uniref:hypothetical protein n=1 Tax=Klebsiella quasipneumoniae TaxID=1463165 RepID=UPI003D6E3B95